MIDKLLNVILRTLASYRMPIRLRLILLRMNGFQIGKNTKVLSGSQYTVRNLIIGNNCIIGRNCVFRAGSYAKECFISIGNNVQIAHNVNICCVTHEIGDENKRAGKNINKSIVIEDGCWIATGVIILPGVKIGHGCIVAAGSVVIKDLEANSLYAGVPAKKVRDL